MKNDRYLRWTFTTDFAWCHNSITFAFCIIVNCGIFTELKLTLTNTEYVESKTRHQFKVKLFLCFYVKKLFYERLLRHPV